MGHFTFGYSQMRGQIYKQILDSIQFLKKKFENTKLNSVISIFFTFSELQTKIDI